MRPDPDDHEVHRWEGEGGPPPEEPVDTPDPADTEE